jgi:hypothetical protein
MLKRLQVVDLREGGRLGAPELLVIAVLIERNPSIRHLQMKLLPHLLESTPAAAAKDAASAADGSGSGGKRRGKYEEDSEEDEGMDYDEMMRRTLMTDQGGSGSKNNSPNGAVGGRGNDNAAGGDPPWECAWVDGPLQILGSALAKNSSIRTMILSEIKLPLKQLKQFLAGRLVV